MTTAEKIDAALIPMLEEHVRLLESEISELRAELLEARATKIPNLTVIAALGAVGGAVLAWGVFEPNRLAVTAVVMLATAVVAWMSS